MAETVPNVIRDVAELRALYREPSPVVQSKKVARIDDVTARFLAGSPFVLLATADAGGNCDVSPRGGPPGFVRVLDERRLAIPDLSGNNLIDSLTNIVANPHVGLLLLIPGRDETLRVEGSALLTTDPGTLALWDDELRTPKVAIVVEVNSLYVHCGKSFRRGRVWDPASWTELIAPDNCEMLVEQLGLEADPDTMRAGLETSYARSLEQDRPEQQ
jgi:uncharacterized protein